MSFIPPPENPSVFTLDPAREMMWASISHYALARGAMTARNYDDAVDFYELAIGAAPAHLLQAGPIYSDLGLARLRAGDLKGAVEAYARALALCPLNHDIRYGAAVAFLQAGDLTRGWEMHPSRHFMTNARPSTYGAPHLTGLPSIGDRVVVWTDQGVGDHVLMASLMPDLVATGASITLVCTAQLVRLFARSFPTVEVIAEKDLALLGRTWDGQCAVSDLARLLRPDFAAFPGRPYLVADAPLAACLRRRYRERAGDLPLVGFAWKTLSQKYTREKTIDLGRWAGVLRQRAAFVSLQYGDVAAELDAARASSGALILEDDRIDAIADADAFAAQVAAMDLVITSSNATAHFAGALGVPCIVVTARGMGQMWHWFEERDDSPFYASVRVARQVLPGVWLSAMAQAAWLVKMFLETGSLWADDSSKETSMRGGG